MIDADEARRRDLGLVRGLLYAAPIVALVWLVIGLLVLA